MKGYRDKKIKGLVAIAVVGDVAYTSEARFDTQTGDPVSPVLIVVDDAALTARKAELDAQIANAVSDKEDIDALIVDTGVKKPK